MRTRSSIVAGFALVAVLLSGCSGSPDGGSSTSTPTRSATTRPTASATPTASPTAGPDAGAGASGQTVAEACGIMTTALGGLVTLSDPETLSAMQADPGSAAGTFAAGAATVKEAAGRVTNAEVKPSADAAAAAADGYFAVLAALISDPDSVDTEQLDQGVLAYTQAQSDLEQLCSP